MKGVGNADGNVFPKRCRCGRSYDQQGWEALPFVGIDYEFELEFRNCDCGSTLAIPTATDD